MSDLSRLRKQLGITERSGRHLTAEIKELQAAIQDSQGLMTRSQERELKYLTNLRDERRKRWAELRTKVEAEERRLLNNPDAFLRFT